MTIMYVICFILMCVGIGFLLGLTPQRIGDDIGKLLDRKQSMKEKALTARGKFRRSRILLFLEKMKRALEDTGKGKHFGVACAISLFLMIGGTTIAIIIGNPFLAPVLAIAFAMIPFLYLLKTVDLYEAQIKLELERGLSAITSSYIRTRNLGVAVKENVQKLKPPIKGIFESFLAETSVITSDMKQAIYHMKEKVKDVVFEEWCDALVSCQDDNNLIDTLQPIVARLADMRIVNSELKVMVSEHKREYWIMVLMVLANIPLLYVLNKDWYAALMYTTLGKIVLAVCGAVILFTSFKMMKYAKPVEYKR